MKKILFLAIFSLTGTICFSQKPVRTVITPIDNRARLDSMKNGIMQMLILYNKQMNAAQETINKINQQQKVLTAKMKELEAQDKLGNFEIQDLMSRYNQAETLSSSVQKNFPIHIMQ